MKLLLTDTFIGISDLSDYDRDLIVERFTYKDISEAVTRAGFDPSRIKKVKFAKVKEEKFLILRTGFLKELLEFCKLNSIKCSELKDKRTKFFHQTKTYTDEELEEVLPNYDYVEHQKRALRALLKTNVGIIKATTSAGKTEIIIAFMKLINLPTLILVNEIQLAEQTANRIDEAGLDCGLCTGSKKYPGLHMVATIGSIKAVKDLSKYKCVIVDECHIVGSKQFQDFFANSSYPLRFGFSATPEGNDDKYRWATSRQFLGSIITEINATELMENEVIVPPEIHFVSIKCKQTLDWDSAYKECIVANELRNKKVIELALKENVQTLILYKRIEHGNALLELLPNAILLHGENTLKERKDAVDKFKAGECQFLLASNIFKQGISINNIECLINASGGKAKTETLQKLGRALRKHKGKEKAIIYDFHDFGNTITERHSEQRKHIYIKTGFTNIVEE